MKDTIRTKIVAVKVTDEEHRKLNERAAKLGMTLSCYIRFILLTQEGK